MTEVIIDPNPPVDPKGADPLKTDNGDQGQKVDLKTLPADQLALVLENPEFWKIGRIKDLQDSKKKLETFESEVAKQKEEDLKKKGEFEELAKTKEQEAISWRAKFENSQTDNRITIAAQKAGAVDVSVVLKLIDRSGIKLNDDGTVTGVDEAVTTLLTASPYLKGNGQNQTPIGGDSNPDTNNQSARKFKASELKDPVFYRANEKEIMKAMASGMIEDDTAV